MTRMTDFFPHFPHHNLTSWDEWVFSRMHAPESGSFNDEAYEYGISDRNDYAVMLARTCLALTGCRATRNRAMPA